MWFVLRLLGSLLLALVLGLGSAYYTLDISMRSKSSVLNGPWVTNLETGGTNADNYTRTLVAITGLLALNKSETMYYTANTDSTGDALAGNCSYRVEGRDPDARWWSITLYGTDHYLIDNPANRYSISQSNVVRAADGSFVVRLSTVAEQGNWIATSPNGFDITLRLYNPGPTVIADPASVALPKITKEACT